MRPFERPPQSRDDGSAASPAAAEPAGATAGRTPAWPIPALVLFSIPLLFYGLGSYSLIDGDEGAYHAIARTMVETGDWSRLVFTGEHQIYVTFMNAPIQYWARAVLITLFGDSYWTMRALSAAFGLFSVLMTFRLVVHLANPRAGFLAGLVQLTTFQFIYMHSCRTGELEPILCFVFTLAAFLFLRSIESGRSFVPHHLCLMALMNLKLPLVIVPVLAELAYFAVMRRARHRFRSWLLAGLALPLGLTWHVAQFLALGDPVFDVFRMMAGEASGSVVQGLGLTGNAAYYGWVLAFGAFPYVLLYPFAILGCLARGSRPRNRSALLLLLLYPAAVFGFFAVVAKLYHWYINPIYPFLSAFVGIWLDRLPSLNRRATVIGTAAVSVAMLIWVAADRWNPLDEFAIEMSWTVGMPRELMRWRSPLEVAPALGLLLTVAVLAAGLLAGSRLLKERFAPAVAGCLAVLFIGFAAIRVIAPLEHTDHVSGTEKLHRQIEGARSAGRPLRFPIPVRDPDMLRVRFFFGDDFEIARDPRAFYLLVREGQTPHDPSLAR